ncbi:MAG: hypothetical protein WCG27_03290 [Pseudomonadota bacterium]
MSKIKIITGLMLCFLFSSSTLCALNEKPKWISSPAEFCPPTELCVVGEGTGHMLAESNARKGMALAFKASIKAKTDVNTYAKQVTQGETILSGDSSEEVSGQIEEKTEQVLDGIVIKEKYEDSNSVFALASLNKAKAAQGFKDQIVALDEKIKHYYEEGKRSTLAKIFKLLPVRDDLNQKYLFMKGESLPLPVSWTDIQKKKKVLVQQNLTVLLEIEEPGKIDEVKQMVVKLLLDNGYRVVTNKEAAHSLRLTGKLVSEKQYVNIKGFEKYKYQLSLEAYGEGDKKNGSLQAVVEQLGRSPEHAYDQAVPQLRDYIKENFDDLNME